MDYLNRIFPKINFDVNDNQFQNKILPLFLEYDNNPNSFAFLKKVIKIDKVNNMKEFLYDLDENEISYKDLDNLSKVVNFLKNLESIENGEELINKLIDGILDENICGDCLIEVLKKLDKFQKFLDKIDKGEKGFSIKISRILENSKFSIIKEVDNFKLKIEYEEELNNLEKEEGEDVLINIYYKMIEINEQDFNYLFNFCMFSKRKEGEKEVFEKFIELYRQIKKLLKLINDLYSSFGYPIMETLIVSCIKKESKCSYQKKEYSLKEMNNYFDEIKYNLKTNYNKEIENNKEILFFYGKQLYLIYFNLLQRKYGQIQDLLKSISNGHIEKFDNDIFKLVMENDPYKQMIQNIKQYIGRQMAKNKLNFKKIIEHNQINEINYKNKGGIYFYLQEQYLEYQLLVLFYNMTGNFPSNNNLLICSKDTSFEEIQSILNRAIYFENNNLFVIAKCEELNINQKRKFLNELKSKISQPNFNIKNILIINFSENDPDFHKEISKLKIINSFDLLKVKPRPKMNEKAKNVEIVESTGCGFGKSAYILNNKNKIIYFPLGGDLNKKYLVERIEKEICDNPYQGKYILYINLSQTEDIDILKEFLFKLLIFKKIDFNNNVKYFDSNVDIKIEIPNDFMNYEKYLKFLDIFDKKTINFDNMQKINLSENVKLVSTFLSKYENKELINKINIETDCNPSQDLCKTLIQKYINIKKPNFYQINIFTKILETEFKFFNDFTGLQPMVLFLTGNKMNLKNIIIESLIKVTRHFTLCPYEELIKSQDKARSLLKSNIEDNDIYICGELALEINSIKYDDIKPSLIAFNNDGNSVTILCTSDEDSKEMKYIHKFYNSQSLEFQKKHKPKFNPEYIIKYYQLNQKLKIEEDKKNGKIKKDNKLEINPFKNKKERGQIKGKIMEISDDEEDEGFEGELMKLSGHIEKNIIVENDEKIKLISNEKKEKKQEKENEGPYIKLISEKKEKINEDIIINKQPILINNEISFEMDEINNDDEFSELKLLKDLEPEEILEHLLSFLNVNGLTSENLKEIVGNYIYTPDNFIKVILILMRLRAKVPVIMMGETGCGKTALIQMAYDLINKRKIPMKILNIHDGTNDKNIIDFIEEVKKQVEIEDKILFEAKKMDYDNLDDEVKEQYEKVMTREQQFKGYEKEVKSRKIWIFFDEINTCNSMGLLSEIFCHSTIRGKPINERFVFIGACNPYRLLSKKNLIDGVLFHKNAVKKKLVYSVKPLPHSLLNFVFNFGALKEQDEKKYIESMIKVPTQSLFAQDNILQNDDDNIKKLMKIQVELISLCQSFMKAKNDISIVSLREVNRYIIFFKYFIDYITARNEYEFEKKKEIEIISFYGEKKAHLDIYICAINLAIYICYYLRLPNKEIRKELEDKINNKNYFEKDFLLLPKIESNYLINNLEIQVGIAKNDILKENLFASFFCFVNKIPLIICGKPGRGKTLSINILEDSLLGKELSNSFICRLYNGLIKFKIQGATNTTAKIIKDTFEKARKAQKDNPDKLVLVVMDEMGLAELSDSNPLKVTHYELEQKENKVSFIGISNWALDASKMNRVIYVIGQEPDENILVETAKEIVQSYNKDSDKNIYEKFKIIYDNLSKAYLNYIEKKKFENSFFHGSRDFYSLIKTTTEDIISYFKNNFDEENELNNDESRYELNRICLRNIERNFGGLEYSIKEFKYEFYKIHKEIGKFGEEQLISNYYDFNLCLKKNLSSKGCRYLLMIFENNISIDALNYMLKETVQKDENDYKEKNEIIVDDEDNDELDKINEKFNDINNIHGEIDNQEPLKQKEIKYIIGSKFRKDKNNFIYSDDILVKIKDQMSKDNILVLKDLEIIYPSLYELFNQNLKEFDKKTYTYISSFKQPIFINDNFKIIVYANSENIPEEDPPFLNRFEKHLVKISNFLDKEYEIIADEIYSTLSEIISFSFENDKKFNNEIFLNKNIKFVDKEEIKGLIYVATKKKIKEKENLIKFISEKIAPTFTEDMIVYMSKFGFRLKHNSFYENIIKIYRKYYRYNLYDYLEKTTNKIAVIYTFSSINENIFENNIKKNNKFFKFDFNQNSFIEIILHQINSINILENKIIDFILEPEKNLCIIKLRTKDLDKLENIINLIENKKTNKIFIIMIHLERTVNKNNDGNEINVNSKTISFLSPINQYFIDNINNQLDKFLDIIDCSTEDIIFNIITMNEFVDEFDNYLRVFSYNIIGDNKEINRYNLDIVKKIKEDLYLKNIIERALKIISRNDKNYLTCVFNENMIKHEDLDFMDTLKAYLKEKMQENFRKLIYLFDNKQIFNCWLKNKDLYKFDIIKKYLDDYIENLNNEHEVILDGININNKKEQIIYLGLKLPFIHDIIKNNLFYYLDKSISQEYFQSEIQLMRVKNIKNNIEKNYNETIEKLLNSTRNEINSFQIIKDILQSNNDKLIENLIHDTLYIFATKNNIIKRNIENIIEILKVMINFKLNPIIIDSNSDNEINIELNLKNFRNEHNTKIENKIEIEDDDDDEEIINNENIDINIYNKDKLNVPYFDFTDIFAKILNFLGGYSKEIFYILEIFHSVNDISDNNIKEMKDLISNRNILMDDKRNEDISKKMKCCFFYIIESFFIWLRQQDNCYKYYEKIYIYCLNIVKLEKIMFLFSNEIFIFEIISRIISVYKFLKLNQKNDLNDLIKKVTIQPDYIKKHDYKNAFDNLLEIKNFLNKLFGKSAEKMKLLNDILLNQYKIVNDDDFRKNIINEILLKENENDEIYLYSYLVELIDSQEKLNVKKIMEEYLITDEHKFQDYKLNFVKKNKRLVLFYFETIIENYFHNIEQADDDNKIKYQKLLENNSLTYLKSSINCINKKKSSNIAWNLYSIAYIKRYIISYIHTIFSDKINYLSKINEINSLILGNTKIKIYILKVYISLFNNDITKLWSFYDEGNDADKMKNKFYLIIKKEYFGEFTFLKNKILSIPYFYSYPCLEDKDKDFLNLIIKKNEKKFDSEQYKLFLNIIKEKQNIENETKENLYQLLNKKKYKYDILFTFASYIFPLSNLINQSQEDKHINNIKEILEYFYMKDKPSKNKLKSASIASFINNTEIFEKILTKSGNDKGEINMAKFRIIFYAFRFYFNLLNSKNENNLYYSLASNFKETITSLIPGMVYEDFKEPVKKNFKKEDFLKKIYEDDCSYIRFRLLNFILYGFIFFLNIDNIVSDDEMNKILIDSMSCFEILQKDFELLDKELKRFDIPNAFIFLDHIFHKIISELEKIKIIKYQNKLNEYEKNIDKIISENMDYKNIINSYLNNRNIYLDIKSDGDLMIISEENLYSNDNNNPEFEYFIIQKIPSIEDFEKEYYYRLSNKQKYPIIDFILDNNSKVKYLKYIPKINELCNYMINYCSYKFTRYEAKTKQIENEIKDKEELVKEFSLIYNKLRPFASDYESIKFDNKFLSLQYNNMSLASFCVDNKESGYGMVIASIYLKMIEWQNSFINDIIKSGNKIYDKYKDLINNEIMIQKCDENDIITLPEKEKLFKEHILKYTRKKKFGNIEYDFKLIEEELSEIIFPTIKKFVEQKNKSLKFVIYQNEVLYGNNENIISLFNKKYPKVKLTPKEKNLIQNFIGNKMNSGEKDLLKFLFSLQILIDIIFHSNYKGEQLISQVIRDNNKIHNLIILKELFGIENMKDNDCADKKLFKINSLMQVFLLFELLCWNKIKENISQRNRKDIEDNIKSRILSALNPEFFKPIKKRKLLVALRRFISRYLYRERNANEINENDKLFHYLKKNELWDKNIEENPKFFDALEKVLDNNNLCVGQALSLYEILGKEEEQKNEDDEDEDDKENNFLVNFFHNIVNKIKKKTNQNKEISSINLNDNNEKERKSSVSNSDKSEKSDSERESISSNNSNNDSFNSERNSINSNDSELGNN